MNTPRRFPTLPSSQSGRMGWVLLWLLGVPVPVLVLLFMLRGCT